MRKLALTISPPNGLTLNPKAPSRKWRGNPSGSTRQTPIISPMREPGSGHEIDCGPVIKGIFVASLCGNPSATVEVKIQPVIEEPLRIQNQPAGFESTIAEEIALAAGWH